MVRACLLAAVAVLQAGGASGGMARVWDSSQWHWERGVSAPSSGASRGQAQVQAGAASLAHAGPHVPARERQRVRVVEGCTAEHFKREVVRTCEPAVLRGLPLGPCLDLWTPEHMMRSGGSKEVSVHVSPHDRMDFITKNFKYHTLAFDELVRRAAYGCDSGEGGVGEELPTVERDGQDFTHALPLRPGAKDIVGKAAANSGSDESPTTAGSPLPAATSVVEKQATAPTVEEERSRRRVAAAADAAAAAAAGAAPGGSFMHKDEKYYLRALGSDPRKSVANLTLGQSVQLAIVRPCLSFRPALSYAHTTKHIHLCARACVCTCVCRCQSMRIHIHESSCSRLPSTGARDTLGGAVRRRTLFLVGVAHRVARYPPLDTL